MESQLPPARCASAYTAGERVEPEGRLALAKLVDTVDLLYVSNHHAFAYQKILENHGIDASSVDRKVMADHLAEMKD